VRKAWRNFHPSIAIFEYLHLKSNIGVENIRLRIDYSRNLSTAYQLALFLTTTLTLGAVAATYVRISGEK
jgi:hypothetical protein